MPPLGAPTPLALLELDLTASVGVKGKNRPADVLHVQDALNAIPASQGTPSTLLHPDGIAGRKTCDAIQMFQLKHFGWKLADGRIDPGGATAQCVSALLETCGSSRWNVRRSEAATPALTNLGDVRTVNSNDRLFMFTDVTGVHAALYHFRPVGDQHARRAEDMPLLDERFEHEPFETDCRCSPYAFVGDATYTEFSPDVNHALIQLTVEPIIPQVSAGPLRLSIRHQWIHPMVTAGASITLVGVLSFVRDESLGERKRPRR